MIFADDAMFCRYEQKTEGNFMLFLVYFLAILKYIIYGMSVFFTGSLVESTDVLDVLALRFLFSFVVFEILRRTKILKINVGLKDCFCKTERSKYIKSLVLAALFEPVLYMFFEAMGISMTTGVMAGVILSLSPVSSVICESIILKDKTSILEKIFLALGIAGVMYIAINTGSHDGKNTVFGMLFIVLAVMCGSLFSVFSRKSSGKFTSMEITYFSTLLGVIAFNSVNVVRHLVNGSISDYFKPYMNVQNMIGFVFLSVISTIIATGMNNFALSKIKSSTMSAFGGVSTLVTISSGVILNNEVLYTYHYIGITFILIRMIGVCYIVYKQNKNIK